MSEESRSRSTSKSPLFTKEGEPNGCVMAVTNSNGVVQALLTGQYIYLYMDFFMKQVKKEYFRLVYPVPYGCEALFSRFKELRKLGC